MADVFSNPETRARMLRVAADYDLLAQSLERDVARAPRAGNAAE